MTNAFLIIDAQVDFCHPEGALFVPGANEDIDRIARLIHQYAHQIDHIVVTLDTHQLLDIAHPQFWQNAEGKHPDLFTVISAEDVKNGLWIPRFSADKARQYIQALETDGQFQHVIWPEHCLIGSSGAALHDTLLAALKNWAHLRDQDYRAVQKGLYPLTEHFGVFQAQVPDPAVPETQFNVALASDLDRFDTIYIMGEAKSHCVANSLKQLLDFAPAMSEKLVLVTDCMSDVTGMGYLADPIYADAWTKNVRFAEAADIFV
ncbi:isochorismatase family protein [Spirosoma sp. KUDC1026]|uniref:isochorismatase family protein n=1 Tax=Spirosoma sp. KUDC1026 TaxID=2745947 RepID=UPI00159BDD58|nr:isochorismatase family protein [Spirosoma sp. KUDC1026]QKZ11727.1 isochorismatase family protein [Spirosoma sp. KUDC1026]